MSGTSCTFSPFNQPNSATNTLSKHYHNSAVKLKIALLSVVSCHFRHSCEWHSSKMMSDSHHDPLLEDPDPGNYMLSEIDSISSSGQRRSTRLALHANPPFLHRDQFPPVSTPGPWHLQSPRPTFQAAPRVGGPNLMTQPTSVCPGPQKNQSSLFQSTSAEEEEHLFSTAFPSHSSAENFLGFTLQALALHANH